MSRKKVNPYDRVWSAARKAGVESNLVRKALSLVPPAPVVDSKVRKKTAGPVPVEIAQITFHHKSWSELKEQYVNLVLIVAAMLSRYE